MVLLCADRINRSSLHVAAGFRITAEQIEFSPDQADILCTKRGGEQDVVISRVYDAVKQAVSRITLPMNSTAVSVDRAWNNT